MSARLRRLSTLAAALALAACFKGDAPTSQVGGTEFNTRLTIPSPVRLPTGNVTIYQRTVSGNKLIDSVAVQLSLVEPLQAPARYQLWVLNELDGPTRPVAAGITRVRTDTTITAAGAIATSTVTINDGRQRFYAGAPLNTVATLKVGPTQSADSVGQTAAWLVLTIQPDSTAPTFAGVPRPMWFRLRDQKGTAGLGDDVISANGAMGFGYFESPAVQRVYLAQGFGRGAFWDQFGDGRLLFSALTFDMAQPPPGYFYLAVARSPQLGRATELGDLTDASTGASLHDADVVPVTGALAQLPNARIQAREDTLTVGCAGGQCVPYAGFASDTLIQVLLEPKARASGQVGNSAVLQGIVNVYLAQTRRPAAGTVEVTATKGGQPVAGAAVALYGAGSSTVITSGITNASGGIRFSNVPGNTRIDVRLTPPAGSTVAQPLRSGLLVPAGDTLKVAYELQ